MEIGPDFKEFEDEPFRIKLMGGICRNKGAYKAYSEGYKELLLMVRKGVKTGAISPKEGRDILQECRK